MDNQVEKKVEKKSQLVDVYSVVIFGACKWEPRPSCFYALLLALSAA